MSFREHWSELQAHGVTVFGISADSIESHIGFAEQQHLPFPLLADVGGEVARRYGVWVEWNLSGRTAMGIARTTFYILPDGTIGHVWEHVTPSGHAEEVLAAAGSIVQVEGRHAGIVRLLNGDKIAPSPFDKGIPMAEVLEKAKPFIKS